MVSPPCWYLCVFALVPAHAHLPPLVARVCTRPPLLVPACTRTCPHVPAHTRTCLLAYPPTLIPAHARTFVPARTRPHPPGLVCTCPCSFYEEEEEGMVVVVVVVTQPVRGGGGGCGEVASTRLAPIAQVHRSSLLLLAGSWLCMCARAGSCWAPHSCALALLFVCSHHQHLLFK